MLHDSKVGELKGSVRRYGLHHLHHESIGTLMPSVAAIISMIVKRREAAEHLPHEEGNSNQMDVCQNFVLAKLRGQTSRTQSETEFIEKIPVLE